MKRISLILSLLFTAILSAGNRGCNEQPYSPLESARGKLTAELISTSAALDECGLSAELRALTTPNYAPGVTTYWGENTILTPRETSRTVADLLSGISTAVSSDVSMTELHLETTLALAGAAQESPCLNSFAMRVRFIGLAYSLFQVQCLQTGNAPAGCSLFSGFGAIDHSFSMLMSATFRDLRDRQIDAFDQLYLALDDAYNAAPAQSSLGLTDELRIAHEAATAFRGEIVSVDSALAEEQQAILAAAVNGRRHTQDALPWISAFVTRADRAILTTLESALRQVELQAQALAAASLTTAHVAEISPERIATLQSDARLAVESYRFSEHAPGFAALMATLDSESLSFQENIDRLQDIIDERARALESASNLIGNSSQTAQSIIDNLK